MRVLALVICLVASPVGSAGASEPSETKPRTLILALDGVPLRSVEAAVQQGAFQDWSQPISMVSTFPSMTNIAFTAILQPFCVHPIAGYETLYFNRGENALVGGTSQTYLEEFFPWRTSFHVSKKSFGSKVGVYTRPMKTAWKMVDQIEGLVLGGTEDPLMAHLASTDLVTHVRGDAPIVEFLLELDERLQKLEDEHRARWGRPLRIVMLSDHGNTDEKVTIISDMRDTFRQHGFRFRKKLEAPEDIVGPTYGAVSYGALYLDPTRAEEVGRVAVGNEAIDLAAWVRQPGEIRVVSGSGEAVVRWRDLPDSRQFSYDSMSGDPLKLVKARQDLVGAKSLGSDGFANAGEWFSATASGYYPDPLRRLVDALSGAWVENPATVILSLHPNRAWGSNKARTGSFLLGGRLEGTHGALERESTNGFLMANEQLPEELEAIEAYRALTPWFAQGDCMTMTRVE